MSQQRLERLARQRLPRAIWASAQRVLAALFAVHGLALTTADVGTPKRAPEWTTERGHSRCETPLEAGRQAPLDARTPRSLEANNGLSPAAVAATAEGQRLFVACASANQVLLLDTRSGDIVSRIQMPWSPVGLVLSPDDRFLYVTCASPRSLICKVDVARSQIVGQIPAGHTALSPALSPDAKTLYVCNRFDHEVAFIDVESGRQLQRVRVPREPIAAALTPEGRYLVVAGHLQAGRANRASAAATVSILDTASGTVVQEIPLRGGSGLVRGISLSPDGAYAAVTHILAHFHWIPRMVHLGWINQNAVSLIDLRSRRLLGTVALDEEGRGAANPWAAAWSSDGGSLCITHAGTHELSVIAAPALLEKLAALPSSPSEDSPRRQEWAYYRFPRFGPARERFDLPSDLKFLEGIRTRVPLTGRGPRALALAGRKAFVAHAFSDSVEVVDLGSGGFEVTALSLAAAGGDSAVRRGERWFNDATLCVQGWQSCASCHDADARADALNWDLLNDGPHNPKNTRSLLFSTSTPPVMALGVRKDTGAAVRAGLQHILFRESPSEVSEAILAYLSSLRPVSSPRLVDGELSAAAARGRRVFNRADVGCAGCHPAPLFTNQRAYNIGTAGDYDRADDRFDTPTLLEVWRTAPYLHDGSATSLRELFTTRNREDRHGHTSTLTRSELDQLIEYVLSL